MKAAAWGGCKIIAALVGKRAMALQFKGALKGYESLSVTELEPVMDKLVQTKSMEFVIQVHAAGGRATTHHHATGSPAADMQPHMKQFSLIRVCEALTGMTILTGSRGELYHAVTGLFSMVNMDEIGQGSCRNAAAAAAAGGGDSKGIGLTKHCPCVAPADGLVSPKSGTASRGAFLSLCCRAESSLLLLNSMQTRAKNYLQQFEMSCCASGCVVASCWQSSLPHPPW